MRRADRLFQIILTVGREGTVTGRFLAEELGVTTRTIYRDIADLMRSGVPIEGEAGVGYRLGRGYQIPPLMFTEEELEALRLGANVVQSWTDTGLGKAASQLLAKVDAVLPKTLRSKLDSKTMIVPDGHVPKAISDHLSELRQAIAGRRKVSFAYPRPFAEHTHRTVRPLVLAYWGGSWTLGAWCETVDEFRTFRVDGIVDLDPSEMTFTDEHGRFLEDYLEAAPAHDAVLGAVVDALKDGEALWPSPATIRTV